MNDNHNFSGQERSAASGLFVASLLLLLFAYSAEGATITFDKSLDVPDRDFTVTYEKSTFSFTIADIGNYKIGENVDITVSGGANNMRLVLFTVDKLTPWFKTFYATSGSVSTTIPAGRFDANCPDVCDDGSGGYKMGPGIYALAVQNRDDSRYFIAKPLIVSDYDVTVIPGNIQSTTGSTVNVTVKISKNGNPVGVGNNNVITEFVQDSTGAHFSGIAKAAATGVYEANIQIPASASGSYRLYAEITTNRNIYQNYPEIIGAASYRGTITITSVASTLPPTPSSSVGGGVEGGQSGEAFKNIESIEHYEKYISKDVPASYIFKQSSNPISEVVITSNINEGDMVVKIETLLGTSSLIGSPPPGLVYKNINILAGKSGFAVPKNIKEAIIKFKVENSWLDINKPANSDVKMVKWDENKWIELETSEKMKDNTHTYYEAKTSSFSAFAITVVKPVITPTAAPEEATVSSITPIPVETTSVQTEVPTSVPVEKTAGFEAILAAAMLCAVYIFWRNRS